MKILKSVVVTSCESCPNFLLMIEGKNNRYYGCRLAHKNGYDISIPPNDKHNIHPLCELKDYVQ